MTAETRKLATIMFTDMVGYSALSQKNERLALELLDEQRSVLRGLFGKHGGREIEAVGDGFFVEFPSALQAAECAIEIQQALTQRNQALSAERHIQVRIGLHLGDVVQRSDGHVHGDGVNIAARIEPLAEPGGVCLSEDVARQIQNKIGLPVRKLGKGELKNIRMPVDIYRLVLPGERRHMPLSERVAFALRQRRTRRLAATASAAAVVALLAGTYVWQRPRPAPLSLPEKPSIAVLPFTNMSGDPQQEYFADGITETIITDLSRLRNLFVIARNSTFFYKGKAVDVRQVGHNLGVRYVLEGSVQQTRDRLRVNVQLIDSLTGRHLWAERYDRRAADIFDVQDDITRNILTELDVTLLQGEQARVWRASTRDREAYDLYLRAREFHFRFTKEDMARAQQLYQRALELDPKFTAAMTYLAWTYFGQGDAGWTDDPADSYNTAEIWARRAIALDDSLGDAHTALGSILQTLERHDEAVREFDRARRLSPDNAENLLLIGWAFATEGRAEEGLGLVRQALRLNPFPPDFWFGGLGDALLFTKRADEAIPAYRKCVDRVPDFIWCQLGLTIAYIESGRVAEARAQATEALRVNPTISAANNTYVRSIGIAAEKNRTIEALRMASLK